MSIELYDNYTSVIKGRFLKEKTTDPKDPVVELYLNEEKAGIFAYVNELERIAKEHESAVFSEQSMDGTGSFLLVEHPENFLRDGKLKICICFNGLIDRRSEHVSVEKFEDFVHSLRKYCDVYHKAEKLNESLMPVIPGGKLLEFLQHMYGYFGLSSYSEDEIEVLKCAIKILKESETNND